MANVKNFLFSLNSHTIVPCAVDLGHADDNMTVAMTFQVLSADEIAGGTVTAEFEIGGVRGLAGNVTVSDSEITVVFSKAMMATEGIGKIQIVVAYPDESLWHSNIVQYRVHNSLKAGDSVPTAEVTAFEKALADYASKAESLNTIAKTAQDIQPALDALKNTAVATDTSVGLMSAEDKAKLDSLSDRVATLESTSNVLVLTGSANRDTSTQSEYPYVLNHTAKEIYDAFIAGKTILLKLFTETCNVLITATAEGDKYLITMQILGGTTATVSGYASEKKIKIIRWI